MKTLQDHLTTYAKYHRDPRNIATHFVGIPMILLGTTVLLSRPAVAVAGIPLSPATLVAFLSAIFYLRLDRRFGGVMSLVLFGSLVVAMMTGAQRTFAWLATGLGLFVVGWIAQAIGHVYEGKKPAFVDDLVGLLIGPLFLAAEVGFSAGKRMELHEEIERIAGPQRRRDAPVSTTP